MTLVLPGLAAGGVWQRRHKSDGAALALADRHYSRKRVGSNQLGPPGRKLVLVTADERAIWVTHYPNPELSLDKLDVWRCVMFRNEGAGLSSELILEAMRATYDAWGDPPARGWATWVDSAKVRSENPGYCFLRAGWTRDRTYTPDRRRRSLVRLIAGAELGR